MKTNLFVSLLFFSLLGWSQNDSIATIINKQRLITNCELITLNSVDFIAAKMKDSNYQAVDRVVKKWITVCGSSEVSKRIEIINAIARQKSTEKLIQDYIDYNYEYNFIKRIEASKEVNFGYIYTNNMYYFDYVPLRHLIDSVLSKKSFELLKKTTLNQDEELLCLLFSGQIDLYKTKLKKTNLESLIKKETIRKRKQIRSRYLDYYGGIYFYSGMYVPLGKKKVFTNDMMFGFGYRVTLFENQFLVELTGRVRINNNDEDFNYVAFDEINTVNAESSTYLGGFVGYKIYDAKKIIIYPKIGIGLDSVDTGLVKKHKHTDDEYLDVEVVHLSTGFSLMTPIFNSTYLGVELTYHYTPYQLDKNLLTEFHTNAFSAELFVRF